MVQLIVGNTKCKIVGLQDRAVLRRLDVVLSYQVQGFQFMKTSNNWDGRYRLLDRRNCFPIGLLSLAEEVLRDEKVKYEKIDNRPKLTYNDQMIIDPASGFSTRDYQKKLVDKAWEVSQGPIGGGIVRAATGCHRKGQGIIMFDGSIKNVEDIRVGDKLMGPDSTPRTVLELCRGKEEMVEVIPVKGNSFVTNKNHILSLKQTRKKKGDLSAGKITDVKITEWKKWSSYKKHINKLYRVPIEFQNSKSLPIEPYFLGILLGDGCMKYGSISVTSKDKEVISELKKQSNIFNCYLRKDKISYYFSKNKKTKKLNDLRTALKSLNLIGLDSSNKFIPSDYKTSSRENRLAILAGILDADGSLSRGCFNYISKSKKLSEDVAFIARSLGFAAYISQCEKTCTNNGKTGEYYRVSISGECSLIPNRIPRKIAPKRKQKKDVLVTGFKIKDLPEENYYGFKLDKDHRYLLDDFTVTHNSGKTFCISMITAKMGIKTVIYVIGIELLYQMKKTIERAFPNLEVGMVGDGHCNVKDITICTIWSAASAFNQKVKISDSDLTKDSARKNKKMDKDKVRQMVRSAEMIIIDECQYAASSTVQFLHRESVSARHRFLFSGTPWRDSGDDILIESVGGPKFFDINASKLIREGWLVPPEIYFIDVPIMRGVGKNYHQVYNNYIVNNKIRNTKIIEATKKLVDTGRKTLILVTKVDHGKILLDRLDSSLRAASLDGSNKTSDRLNAINAMKSGELDVLIASKIFDQGIDIPELDGLVLAGSGKSSGRALQRIGRVIRKREGKEKAYVIDFWDNCKYLREHSEARYKIYSTEPEFRIKLPK